MIESILSFSLKSAICSAVFFSYYLLALKNVRMYRFNRAYLLVSTALSLLLPFTGLEMFQIKAVELPTFPLLEISGKGQTEMPSITNMSNSFPWSEVLAGCYFTIAFFMLLRLITKSAGIFLLKRTGQTEKQDGFVLVKTDDPRAPFSFMNMLFWPMHMRQDSSEEQSILMHELAHIRQRHTPDKLFMQLALAACWLNPFNWLIRKELWLQHEFLADELAIEEQGSEAFARMLLYGALDTHRQSIINPFFQSPIKRRLLMLTQPAEIAHNFLRRFLSIPVLLIAVFLLSAHKPRPASVIHSSEKIIVVLDAAHGGTDGGGKSADGYIEKNVTLALCKRLTALANEYNIEIIATRTEDADQSLEERVKKSNSSNADVFLSVHVNQSSAVRDNTYQLGVNPKGKYHNETMLLASAIASQLKGQQLPVEIVDHSMAYIIRENNHPALLIECGNLDDPENIALLQDGVRTETLCRNILSGIVYYKTKLRTR